MSRKIIGVTVGTPISRSKIEETIKPVKSVNNVTPDDNGNVNVPVGGDAAIYVGSDENVPEGTKIHINPEGEALEIATMEDIDRLSEEIANGEIYTLKAGETLDDVPDECKFVYDPYAEDDVYENGGTSVTIDKTLTIDGAAADAKATGDKIGELSKAIADKTGGSKIYYAICETPGETNPKMAYTVTKDFVLEKGARVGVWFKYNNIGSQNLNVDDTGAFQWISARKSDGTIVSDTPTMYKAGGQLHWFTFDGEYWIVDDSIRAGEDTVGKVSLSQIRTEAAKNHYTKTEIDNKFSALDTALAEAIGSGVIS